MIFQKSPVPKELPDTDDEIERAFQEVAREAEAAMVTVVISNLLLDVQKILFTPSVVMITQLQNCSIFKYLIFG